MNSNIWWIGPLVLAVLRLLYVEASLAKASVQGSGVVFRAATGTRAALGLSSAATLGAMVFCVSQGETWAAAFFGAAIVSTVLLWPCTIVVDPSGIARYAWWRRPVRIAWETVVLLERGAAGDWWVHSSNGTTIQFDRYHVDAARFEAEVLHRAKLDRAKERGAPTDLRG